MMLNAVTLFSVTFGPPSFVVILFNYSLAMPSHEHSKAPWQREEELASVEPVPFIVDESSNTAPAIGPNYKRLSSLAGGLHKLQKYSSITFNIFTVLHGATVLVAPAISGSVAEEMLSMTRIVYQGFGLEGILVWGSLGCHILSGISIRIIRNIQYRIRYGDTRRNDKRTKRNEKSLIDSTALGVDSDGTIKVNNDEEIGLTGGVTSMIGLGAKRSFSYRVFGMSPLQVSGYVLIPFVLYHVLQTRISPFLVEGDSSYISFEYVAYIFNDKLHSLWAPALNWVIYPSLIVLSVYHNIYGMMKWMNIKNLRLRKLGAMSINILIISGIWSLYQISRIDTSSTLSFILRKFDTYLDYFYYLKK